MKKSKLTTCIRAASLTIVAASISMPSFAAIPDYAQNFDSLAPAALDASGNEDPSDDCELMSDGWIYFGATFPGQDASGNAATTETANIYQYGSYNDSGTDCAPNSGGAPNHVAQAFSGVNIDAADASGNQFLNIFSNYQDPGHTTNTTNALLGTTSDNVQLSSVLREYPITADDFGKTITFSFDARRPDDGFAVGDNDIDASGNIFSPATASAFIKTIDSRSPAFTYAQTNLVAADMTAIVKGTWVNYSLELAITDPELVGQTFQVGFENTSSNYSATGVNYDNVNIVTGPSVNIPIPCIAIAAFGGLLGLAGINAMRKRKSA